MAKEKKEKQRTFLIFYINDCILSSSFTFSFTAHSGKIMLGCRFTVFSLSSVCISKVLLFVHVNQYSNCGHCLGCENAAEKVVSNRYKFSSLAP